MLNADSGVRTIRVEIGSDFVIRAGMMLRILQRNPTRRNTDPMTDSIGLISSRDINSNVGSSNVIGVVVASVVVDAVDVDVVADVIR